MDPEALAAIAENASGIETLSNERIGAEMTKFLSAPDPAPAVAAMRASGALGWVFPGADDRALTPLVHLEQSVGVKPDPLRRLAALGGQNVEDLLRLSKKSARKLDALRHGIESMDGGAALGYRHGSDLAISIVLLRAALLEMPLDTHCIPDIQRGVEAVFPIKPADLMPVYEGAELGQKLKRLEALWLESDFSLGREELLLL